MPTERIPDDFPHIAVLHAADPPINTFGQLAKFSEDYSQIPGIGSQKAPDIKKAVAKLEANERKATVVNPLSTVTPPASSSKPAPSASPAPSAQPNARFRYDSTLVVDAFAVERKSEPGVWDVTMVREIEGKKKFRGVRQVAGEPAEPGEFSLNVKPDAKAT